MANGQWGGALDPNVFHVNVRFTRSGSKCQSGFYLRDRVVNDNSEQKVADTVAGVIEAGFRSFLIATDAVEGVDVVQMGTELGAWHPINPGAGTFGAGGVENVPAFLAVNVSLKSSVRKRYGQGRMFWPISSDAWFDGDNLTAGGIARFQPVIDTMVDNFGVQDVTNDLILCNVHEAFAGRGIVGQPGYIAPRPRMYYDVISVRLNNRVTFLRSRKLGVGS